MAAFTYRMPAGIPGTVNRAEHATIEAQYADTTNSPDTFGGPVKVAGTKVQKMGSADAATAFYGFLVRAFPGGPSTDPIGTDTVPTPTATGLHALVNVLRRGYLMTRLSTGSVAALKNGTVYLRVATAGTGKPIGGLEAAADGANTVVLPAVFMGPADSSGNIEIAVNI